MQDFLNKNAAGPIGEALDAGGEDVMKMFSVFVPDTLIQIMIDETNRYGDQYFAKNPILSPHARATRWKPVTMQEMKTFLGLSLLTGNFFYYF